MPLINENRGNGLEDITMKKVRNFNKFHTNLPVVEGEGLFSGLVSAISSGAKIIRANSDVIKTAASAGANVASAGKNIADAVNSTRRVNAEIEQLKKIKEYRRLMSARDKEPIITYTPTTKRTETSNDGSLERLKPAVSKTRLALAGANKRLAPAGSDTHLSQEQQNAIENLAKNFSKKKLGKGFRIY